MKATAHKKAFDIAQCTDIASVVCYIDGEENGYRSMHGDQAVYNS